MDTFNNPLPHTYLTKTIFTIPTKTGGVTGIAVTRTEYEYLNATYALLITGIFGFAWQLVVYLVLMFYPTEEWPRKKNQEKDGVSNLDVEHLLGVRKRKANRYIALITIWNSPNPWVAMYQLYLHAFKMIFSANDRATCICDIVVILLALLVGAATVAAGISIPSHHLEKGAVAPANPAVVFTAPTTFNPSNYFKVLQIRAPAIQRAMGIVGFASHALRQGVNVYPVEVMDWTGPRGERVERTAYNYNVTGLDFGLQHKNAVSFVYQAQGACTLEYNWLNTSLSDNSSDVYSVYGTHINVSRVGIMRPPGGTVKVNASSIANNMTYAIIPDTVGRVSLSKGSDPWYTTSNTEYINSNQYYVVDHRRPVLSCWQQDTWSYGENIGTILDLGYFPGLDLPDGIQNIILDRLAVPMIYSIGEALGSSILISAIGHSRLINASIGNHTAEIEHLIFASYIATQRILQDTTMVTRDYGFRNSTGYLEPGIGKFVITSGDVVSLSLETLIIVPLLWLFFWAVRIIATLSRYANKNSGYLSRFTLRAVGFQPVQMYRLLDEEVCGYRDDWCERKGEMPYIGTAKQVWAGERIQASGGKAIWVSSTTEVGEVVPAADSSVPLFAAPKVVLGPDGNYHLRFTEPIGEMKSEGEWTWGKLHPGRKLVTDGPASDISEKRWDSEETLLLSRKSC